MEEDTDDPVTFDGTSVFVAEKQTAIVGFGACCEQRDPALRAQGFDGEVNAVYVLRSHQSVGVGKALIALMADDLVSRGRQAASLWVLRENNPARTFYERLGGTLVGERTEIVRGTHRSEVAYGWSDLASLQCSRA